MLGRFWKHLGTILPHLSPICPILGLFWELFGANLGLAWAPRGHLEPVWRLLGTKCLLEARVLICLYVVPADWRDFGVHSGAQNWSTFCYFRVHVLDSFLDNFWRSFGVHLGVILGPKVESKSCPFFGKAPGGHLEALWEASWLS